MAFGQQSGPPATQRQVRELLELLERAGHADFRDARGPMGFTQRQAGGRFTRDEADGFIEQLQAELDGAPTSGAADEPPAGRAPVSRRAVPTRVTATERTLRAIPAEQLAAELQRRGWIVVEP